MKHLAIAICLLTACGPGHDFERTGDVAWKDGRWPDAMVAYRNEGNIPRVIAKYADAAFRGGFLPEAAAGWRQLGTLAPARAQEAAAGLMRVALAAERERDQVVLASAIADLRSVAPDWPAGRLVRHLEGDRGLSPADAALVWPVLISAAPDSATTMQSLLNFGRVETQLGDCVIGIAVYQSAARRSATSGRDSIVVGMAPCELHLGLTALTQSLDGEAETWFGRAVAHDPTGVSGRRALVGLGDARLRQGDLASALIAWRAVVSAPVPPDSIFELAVQRLQSAQANPDSSGTVPGWY